MSVDAGARLRTFVALDLSDEFRERLRALAAQVAPRLPNLRFVAPEAQHVTLRFLGSTTAATVARLRDGLAAAAAACPPAHVRVHGLGFFPPRGRVRVAWLGLELPARLHELQATCERLARAERFPPASRPFEPHLTLGRWREPAPRPDVPPVDLGVTDLAELVLFRSELSPKGARHTALHRFALGAGA